MATQRNAWYREMDQALRELPNSRSQKGENVWGLKTKIISQRVEAMGSRSAFIVPMMVGNSTHEDPAEGREASWM